MAIPSRKQVVMDAAEKLFRNRRIHEITLDEVAQRAGVGKGTIYRYFADKDDLFFQVATSGFDDLCELVKRKVRVDVPMRDQLLDACVAISNYFEGRREMFQIIVAESVRMPSCKESLRERWFRHRKRLIHAVAEILQRGADEGLVRTDIPIEVMTNYLLGMLRTRNLDMRDFPGDARSIEFIVDLFLAGASARVTLSDSESCSSLESREFAV